PTSAGGPVPRTLRLTTVATWAPAALLALLPVALGLSSCGRALTTEPRTHVRPTSPNPDDVEVTPSSGIDAEVVVTLADGVDAAEFAASHDAVLVSDASAEHTISLAPGPGQTAVALADQLASDARALTTEPNGWLE